MQGRWMRAAIELRRTIAKGSFSYALSSCVFSHLISESTQTRLLGVVWACIGSVEVDILRYADDAVLAVQLRQELQCLLNQFGGELITNRTKPIVLQT